MRREHRPCADMPLSVSRKILEMGEALERPESILDLFVIQDSQTVKTKGFYGKGGHHASEDDGLFERVDRPVSGRCKIPEEAARERVAGASRVADVLQRKRRCPEHLTSTEHQHAVFTPLDDEVLGPARQHRTGHFHQVGISSEGPRLPIINDENVYLFEHPPKGVPL